MSNKFRQIEPVEVNDLQNSARPVQVGLDGGYRGDVSPREIPMGSSPELGDVRFERRAIRKDFGWTAIGEAAANPILIILEHKYIESGGTFQRLIRISRNAGGFAVLEVWDGAFWVEVDVSTEQIQEVYLSGVSALGCAYFADGQQVLEWCEILDKTPQENNFPEGNELTIRGQETEAIISPGSSESIEYTVNYDLVVIDSPNQDTVIELEFFHGLVSLGVVAHAVSRFESFPFSLPNQEFKFNRVIADLDTVAMKVKSAIGGGTTNELNNVITQSAGAPDVEGVKEPALVPAVDNRYRYFYQVSGPTTVGFYYNRGTGWVLATQQEVSGAGSLVLTIEDFVEPDAKFGMGSLAGGGVGDTQVGWDRPNVDFEVHGHNKDTQGDETAGVEYDIAGAVISSFEQIDPGPGGRFLQFFARRLVVLRNIEDTQVLSWSMDSVLNDFRGAGSGESILVEARSDATDDLMGTAVLGSNFMALFRKRSTWRVFETGEEGLELGAVSWIENLGTASPFSIQEVPGGAIFLAHDLMVYFISEQGIQPIGQPLHQYLIETLTSNLDKVDSGWDAAFQEYYIGIPENGAAGITKVWIFDFGRFNRQQETVWRPRSMAVQRIGTTSRVIERLVSLQVNEPSPGSFVSFSDFSEFEVGAVDAASLAAAGWGTVNTGLLGTEIVNNADGEGNVFRINASDKVGPFWPLAWAGIMQYGEVLVRTYLDNLSANKPVFSGGLGLDPDNDLVIALNMRIDQDGDASLLRNTQQVQFAGITMPSAQEISGALSNGIYVWSRLRVDDAGGGLVRFRWRGWVGDLDDEPGVWSLDVTTDQSAGGDPVIPFNGGPPFFYGGTQGPQANVDKRISYIAFSSDPDNFPPPEEF